MTVEDVIGAKGKVKLTMLAVYDYPSSRIADEAGIDMVLVGDSLAKYVLGLDSNDLVGMTEMIHHTRAVSRGAARAMVVGDMPACSCAASPAEAAAEARRFRDEAGCDAVKVEWTVGCLNIVGEILETGVPVIGHIGPALGAGAPPDPDLAAEAAALESLGCFALLLDHVDPGTARRLTEASRIPTIGVGSGNDCDGQAAVLHQLVGWVVPETPRPYPRYLELWPEVEKALEAFKRDVSAGGT
jgi:3-methyl-2-oxobutanoate hydroxymethyltransferase